MNLHLILYLMKKEYVSLLFVLQGYHSSNRGEDGDRGKQMLFKSLLEYNNDSIISIDSIGRITYANPATYEIFGYRFEELNNKFIFEFINKEYEKDFQIIFKEAMQGRAKQIVSKKYVHKEGYELYISLRTIPIIVNGEIVEYILLQGMLQSKY